MPPQCAVGHYDGNPAPPRSRRPFRLAITAVPKIPLTPEKPKNPQKPSRKTEKPTKTFP
jgi:hypothetical protein